ncbi:hypothetical protein GTA08_BOTSDO06326 [Botryosphaeria dothidea]|uniref:Uncharacterized protein n=1 Tax=Botryosphaeria dothidea TaxID=55169 RepID=A0A8H4IKZ3_9PEZI|nr:hypothetical protein GTA08_BOTSDO10173 [Botryosphaeria dothidea]KAF4305308.1 hypothetical protein GTA08_BOTSDO06326 [Botryosphaeria dothidea]
MPLLPNRAFSGAIIAASIIVAAGIAVYQNPQVQQWIDARRRKIAIALHNLGDEINPPVQRNRNAREADEQRRRREEIIRRNRNELVRRAREEGVSVDLDELARIGDEYDEKNGRPRGQSFDDLVNEHGMLRESASGSTLNEKAATTATDNTTEQGLRNRRSGARGFVSGASYANPFADEESVLFDRDLIGVEENSVDGDEDEEAPVPHDFTTPSRETTATLEAEPIPQLVDLSEPFSAPFQQSQERLIPVAEPEDATASFYSTMSGPVADAADDADMSDDDLAQSTGTLTPTEDNFSTDASLIGRGADDIAVLSTLQNSLSAVAEDEANANPFGSEGGFEDDRFSDASFSDIGARTPSSWTDVGSDFGSETGSQAGH